MSKAASTFHISVRHNIWRVTLDGAFYGDYHTRAHATEGAAAGAASLRANGRKVTIVAPFSS
jgi:hypothetical protein